MGYVTHTDRGPIVMPMFYVIVRGEYGRSTARKITAELNQRDPRAIMDSCDAPLKHFIATALNVKYDDIPMQSPVALLDGHTPSSFIKLLSEGLIEGIGDDFFGRLLMHRHLRLDSQAALSGPVRYVVVYDLVTEADAEVFGENVKSIRADAICDMKDVKRMAMSIINERITK